MCFHAASFIGCQTYHLKGWHYCNLYRVPVASKPVLPAFLGGAWERGKQEKNRAHFESLAPLLAREGGLRLYSRDFQSPGTWLIADELAVGLTPPLIRQQLLYNRQESSYSPGN